MPKACFMSDETRRAKEARRVALWRLKGKPNPVKKTRIAYGLTKEEMAEHLTISISRLIFYEQWHLMPTEDLAIGMLELLGDNPLPIEAENIQRIIRTSEDEWGAWFYENQEEHRKALESHDR